MDESIIEMRNIVKSFYIGTSNQLDILKNIDITIKKGEFVSIVSAYGSGKSTLMNIIGALDRPTSGTYILAGTNVNEKAEKTERIITLKDGKIVAEEYNDKYIRKFPDGEQICL